MEFIGRTKPKLLIADEGKQLRDKKDVYISEHIDEMGNIVPDHTPYYSTLIFLGDQINSLEDCKELYTEEEVK